MFWIFLKQEEGGEYPLLNWCVPAGHTAIFILQYALLRQITTDLFRTETRGIRKLGDTHQTWDLGCSSCLSAWADMEVLSLGGEDWPREESPSLEWAPLSTGDSPKRKKYNESCASLACLPSLLAVGVTTRLLLPFFADFGTQPLRSSSVD